MTEAKPSIWKAALVAPIGVPLAITLWYVWQVVASSGLDRLHEAPIAIGLVFMFGLPFAYGAMLLLGVPYVLLLRAKGWLAWTPVCIGAAVFGAVIWSGYWSQSVSYPPSLAKTVPVGTLIGLLVGAIFSAVARLPKRVAGDRCGFGGAK